MINKRRKSSSSQSHSCATFFISQSVVWMVELQCGQEMFSLHKTFLPSLLPSKLLESCEFAFVGSWWEVVIMAKVTQRRQI